LSTDKLLWLGDLETISYKDKHMRRGELRFDDFISSLRGYESVSEHVWDLTLSSKQKIRVEVKHEGKVLKLIKILPTKKERKNESSHRKEEVRQRTKGHSGDVGRRRTGRHVDELRPHRKPFRSEAPRVQREAVEVTSEGPDEFLSPMATLERWAREKGVRVIWQSQH